VQSFPTTGASGSVEKYHFLIFFFFNYVNVLGKTLFILIQVYIKSLWGIQSRICIETSYWIKVH